MNDKNKSSLIFCATGILTGIISGVVLKGMSSYLILVVAVGIFYATSYLVPLVGVNVERLGGKTSVIKGGVFSFLMWWLFCWFLTYNIA